MIQLFGNGLKIAPELLGIARSIARSVPPQAAPQTAPLNPTVPLFLSGSQFGIALIAGVAMAFAFQFLLSNLSIATGISAGINPVDTDAEGWGKKIRRVEAKVGSTTLFIVNTALFIACFLAVKLTFIHNAALGAIVAVVIWSVYFLLLLWLSSQAIGSLLGAASSTASSGVQGVIGTIGAALSGRAASSQIANTVETSVEAVSQELQSVLTSDRLRDSIEDYISGLKLPSPQKAPNQVVELLGRSNLLSSNGAELFELLKSATPEDLQSGQLRQRLTQILGLGKAANGNGHSNSEGQSGQSRQSVGLRERTLELGTSALMSTLMGRGGLPGMNAESLTQSLNALGQQLSSQVGHPMSGPFKSGKQNDRPELVIRSDVEHYLLDSPGWYLRPDSLDRGFREILFDPDAEAGQVRQQLEQLNRGYFVEVLQRRQNVNPDQINDIADELEVVRQEVLDQVRAAEVQERSQALRQQVEAYLSSTPKEALQGEQIQQDFMALLADPDVTYETLGNRLLQFDRGMLMQLLQAGRQDLSPEEAEQILNQLEGARDRFLNQSQADWQQLQAQAGEFRQRVESYLRETNPAEFTPDAIRQTFQTLLAAPNQGLLALRVSLGQIDRPALEQILSQRQDLNPEQLNPLLDQISSIRDSILHAPQALTGQAKEQVDRLTQKIAEYLRSTNLEELNPEGLQRDLQQLLDDPQAGLSALGKRFSQIDRETLVQLLSQRQDLSPEQVNRAIDQTLDALQTIARAPRQFAVRTRDRVRDLQSDLADYLRNTDRSELNPEGIQRDLQLLLRHPQAGLEQWGERLSQVDRDTLVALLSQREDISPEDAAHIVDQVLSQITSIRDRVMQQAKAVKDQVQSTANQVSDQVRQSLNSLERPELNYEGIQRDFRKLFSDPQAGLEALRDRLGQFDRNTLVAILSSRSDISEEQANRIVDQIEAARDSVLQRAEHLQAKAEERIKTLKHQAKAQAEEVQKTAASAAWWVFGTAVTSAATAAIAGFLASGSNG